MFRGQQRCAEKGERNARGRINHEDVPRTTFPANRHGSINNRPRSSSSLSDRPFSAIARTVRSRGCTPCSGCARADGVDKQARLTQPSVSTRVQDPHHESPALEKGLRTTGGGTGGEICYLGRIKIEDSQVPCSVDLRRSLTSIVGDAPHL